MELLIILTVGGLSLAFILLVIAVWTKQVWLSKFITGAAAIWIVFYMTALSGISPENSETSIESNENLTFCEFYIDCRIRAGVSESRTAKQNSDEENFSRKRNLSKLDSNQTINE